MSKILNFIGIIIIAGSFLTGLGLGIYGSSWGALVTLTIQGFLAGIVFLALAMILDRLDENRWYLEELLERLPELPQDQDRPKTLVNRPKTKSTLEALQNYKMNAKD